MVPVRHGDTQVSAGFEELKAGLGRRLSLRLGEMFPNVFGQDGVNGRGMEEISPAGRFQQIDQRLFGRNPTVQVRSARTNDDTQVVRRLNASSQFAGQQRFSKREPRGRIIFCP